MTKTSFDLEFRGTHVQKFIEYKHPINSLHLEKLDDEISAYTLFKLVDYPFDLATCMITVSQSGGLNPSASLDGMNFDITKEQMLAMAHQKSSNVRKINELLDVKVQELMKSVSISDISDFIIDCKMLDFAQVVKASKTAK